MSGWAEGAAAGARNLLLECGMFAPGDEVLIAQERPALGWYAADLGQAIEREARRLGLRVRVLEVGAPGDRQEDLLARVREAANVVFLARIGDQDRFSPLEAGKTRVMCYVRSAADLASRYGRTSHRAMRDFKAAVDSTMFAAKRIEVSCPRGSRLAGSPMASPAGEVTVRRFPYAVPTPTPARGFSGDVIIDGYLTPTGSRAYTPACLALDAPVRAHLEAGRIAGFEGRTDVVDAVQRHYDHVAQMFGIDGGAVDSWHAGIHPGCRYSAPAEADPDRWSNTIFGNPRILHFHSCGAYPPGEISWMLVDHTVTLDGEPLWHKGRLLPHAFPATAAVLRDWPELAPLFATPERAIGLSDAGA